MAVEYVHVLMMVVALPLALTWIFSRCIQRLPLRRARIVVEVGSDRSRHFHRSHAHALARHRIVEGAHSHRRLNLHLIQHHILLLPFRTSS